MKAEMINSETIKLTIKEWSDLTSDMLEEIHISLPEIKSLLLKTYMILYLYHKVDYVPKSICELLSNLDEFLYFSAVPDPEDTGIDSRVYYRILEILHALKHGFFKDDFKYAFPKLEISDLKKGKIVIDFETDVFEERF